VSVIRVAGDAPYDVVVGTGLAPALPASATRVAILYAAPLSARAEALAKQWSDLAVLPIEVPDAEAGKTLRVAEDCWDRLGAAGFTRTDAVVGVGGGAVTDLAGFVAACWLRGVPVVQVPTSLLAMVDAAVGGKTGVNTAAGKNLVGAFHPPYAVYCDLDALETLPPLDFRAGLAEVVKCGFIADPAILALIERDPSAATDPTTPTVRELVERAIRVKAVVVGADLREAGPREILNYGHTLGHAIENIEEYGWRHGDAIAVGLVFAAELGVRCGRLAPTVARRHREILAALGLPVSYDAAAWPRLQAAMRVDKKSRASRLRFVILDDVARPGILEAPRQEWLDAAYRKVSTP
jgi:3-dehydroquinate synthase